MKFEGKVNTTSSSPHVSILYIKIHQFELNLTYNCHFTYLSSTVELVAGSDLAEDCEITMGDMARCTC